MYYVFCIFECLRAPRKMGKCSLGLPSLNNDFIIIIIIIIITLPKNTISHFVWIRNGLLYNSLVLTYLFKLVNKRCLKYFRAMMIKDNVSISSVPVLSSVVISSPFICV